MSRPTCYSLTDPSQKQRHQQRLPYKDTRKIDHSNSVALDQTNTLSITAPHHRRPTTSFRAGCRSADGSGGPFLRWRPASHGRSGHFQPITELVARAVFRCDAEAVDIPASRAACRTPLPAASALLAFSALALVIGGRPPDGQAPSRCLTAQSPIPPRCLSGGSTSLNFSASEKKPANWPPELLPWANGHAGSIPNSASHPSSVVTSYGQYD